LNCIIEKVGTTTNIYYTYQDYLGSLLAITNAAGTVVMEQNFDAWGRNRNTTDWTYNNIATPPLTWLTRGYTGHEHLPQFTLINMNGRLYDPLLGRMLSPDNYTQGGSQGYNRYTYAMNNPLKYTDPSGQTIQTALIGAGIGAIANVAITGLMGKPITWNTALQGAIIGFSIGLGMPNLSTLGALGKAAIRIVVGVANSYLPSLNIPLGAGTSVSVSPAFAFGSQGLGLGANFTFNVETPAGSLSLSQGITGYAAHGVTGKSFFEGRMGWRAAIGPKDFRVILGGTSFSDGNDTNSGPNTSAQRTGIAGIGGRGWSVIYENDGAPFNRLGMVSKEKWSTTNSNGYTDGHRTAAFTVTVGDFSLGMRIFTGNRDFKQDIDNPVPGTDNNGYPYGKVGNSDASQYLSSVLYVGYQNFRVGIDHYLVGYYGQNIVAHKVMTQQAFFPWLDAPNRPNKLYGGYISTNPNTSW
jgi:RHS repeat-associated protein